jgi:hypothetical protein
MLQAAARSWNHTHVFLSLALMSALGFIPSSGCAEGLPREKLTELKRATVFVKVIARAKQYSGSGFIFERMEGKGYIITNAHVVAPIKGWVSAVEVIVNSGMTDEQVLPAKVVAIDESLDLAVLGVDSKDLPSPIPTSKVLDLYETMPVFIFGFPFGDVLRTGKRNPEITIVKGGVSSLRKDEYGNLAAVQIDGSVNPGHSGGPIVTEDGDLVGVAVAKVVGTQIGLAIPAAELRELLLGRIVGSKFTQKTAVDGKGEFEVNIDLIDPHERIKAVTVWTIPVEELKQRPRPDATGRYSQASPEMQSHELKVSGQTAHGKMILALGPPATSQRTYNFQISVTRGDDRTLHTAPAELSVKTKIREVPAGIAPGRP